MKQLKLMMLCCIGTLLIASKSFGQANPFINVLPSNSGIVAVGETIDIVVTIGNTGPISTIPQAKLRPIIQVPPSVTFLPTASQVGLPAGWTILSNTGSQLRICNSADPIPVSTSRIIILKAQGVTVSPPQTFSGNINFGNGTTCSAGTSVAGDLTTDNSATSTVQVVAPVTTLNLNAFIQGYWDGTSAMLPVLANQGQSNPATHCDSLLVELHQAAVPTNVAYSTLSVLHTNGTATAIFPAVTNGYYYIVLKHRNTLETWSGDSVAFTGSTTSYNFSTAASQAYGSNQIELTTATMPNGIFALYSGDISKDSGEATDLLDLNQLEQEINNFSFGYNSSDLNGDGNVDLLDNPFLENNISSFIYSAHP